MKNHLFTILFSFFLSILSAQSSSDTLSNVPKASYPDTIPRQQGVIAEEMPSFPGGMNAFMVYLYNSIRYPETAVNAGKEGTAFVTFIVKKDGTIDSVFVSRSIPGAPELDAEAVRVISAMPTWIPARLNGTPVNCKVTVPVKFTLDTNTPKKKKKRK